MSTIAGCSPTCRLWQCSCGWGEHADAAGYDPEQYPEELRPTPSA